MIPDNPQPVPPRRVDRAAWLAVAWAAAFGLLYARMVLERKLAPKLPARIADSRSSQTPSHSPPATTR